MKTEVEYDVEEIKAKLIECCIHCKANDFLPYLFSPSVTVDFPNKIRFYGFLKTILNCARQNSSGILELRIEKEPRERENVLSYNFYDEVYKYPRINLKVKEENNCLHLDLLPF